MLYNSIKFMSEHYYSHILLFLILFDFITGYAKAYIWKVADSGVGIKGIVKHIFTFILYFALGVFCKFVNMFDLGQTFLLIICLNYCLSILENVGVMGIYVPKFLKNKVETELKKYDDIKGEK